jgi:putative redox protein
MLNCEKTASRLSIASSSAKLIRLVVPSEPAREVVMAFIDVPHDPHVVVHGQGHGFAQVIVARSHRLAADEPAANGGTDTGPTPYDLLLAALGS